MRTIKTILAILILTSCNKEVDTTTTPTAPIECNCYEYHEKLEFMPQQWVNDFSTNPQPDLCSKATGEWIYSNSSSTKRYKVICY